jgi:hypothetical protein
LNLPHDRDHIGRALVGAVNNFSCRLLARLVNLWVAERNATRLSGCQGLRSALMKRARSFRASAANKCGMKESTSDISAQRPTCSPATISGSQATNSSSSTLASFRSGVSKTSVNKLWTGSEKTPLSSKALWYQCHECAVRQNATPLSCQDSSSRTQRHDPDGAARSRSRHRSAGAPQCSVQVRTHGLPGKCGWDRRRADAR